MKTRHCYLELWLALSVVICTTSNSMAQSFKTGTKKMKPNASAKNATQSVPAGIHEFASENFVLHTDLSADDAKALLERLEKMLVLIEKYYGKPNSQIIEMNVVHDRQRWPPGSIPAAAIDSIMNEAGITLSATLSQQNGFGEKQITAAKSIVWAVSERGVPQHEAVHAYCHQNFGRTGPTWYSEGMAELGQYWQDKNEGIRIHDEVMKYLKNSEPKDLLEITAAGQKTGDSWRNYAWRWALCHLLSTNPNYSPRFKPLGMALLSDQRTSFEDVYGSMSKEISFEYLFFLQHMNQGYRSDLCSWDWKTKSQRLRGTATIQSKIVSNRGWQASRVMVKEGDKIAYTASGEWDLGKSGPKVGPDGNDAGMGRLEGVLFSDYQLTPPFPLGASGDYEATSSGTLFLRCRDDWCEIADNGGAVTVKFKVAP